MKTADYLKVYHARNFTAAAAEKLATIDMSETDLSCDNAYDVAMAMALLAQALVLLNRAAA